MPNHCSKYDISAEPIAVDLYGIKINKVDITINSTTTVVLIQIIQIQIEYADL